MGSRGPFGGPDYGADGVPELVIVDKVLRTSYDVVRYVASQMPNIEIINTNIGDIQALGPYIIPIQNVAGSIAAVEAVAVNLVPIADVAGRIDQVIAVFSEMDAILTAKDQAITSAENANESAAAADQAKNDAVALKNGLLSGISANASALAYGQPPSASYNSTTKVITFGIPVTPVTELNIGVVSQGAAAASITGPTTYRSLNLTIPKGDSSWTPVFANVVDGARVVQKVVDWVNGSGPKPDINVYVSATGYTTDVAAATNVRGPLGAGTGDMSAQVYDPNLKNSDAFNMANMSESSTKKILTDVERTKLAGIASGATANSTDAQLRDRSTHTGSQAISTITGLQTALDATEKTANKGQTNGYASLGSDGKVPVSQLPESLVGAMNYQGTWNANTNTPAIPAASGANKGWYFVVDTNGATTISSVSDWKVGDWIVSNGTKWDKIDSSDQVTSVNGQTGTVVLTKGSVGLGNVDNTSDANKPVSSAQQTALDSKAALSHTHSISDVTGLSAALQAMPAGAVIYFAANSLPTGWLKANGAAVSRAAYADLFAAIGTTHGAGDGSTTFNLPDLRGEFIRGFDDGRGVDSGRTFGSAQSSQNLAHTHTGTTGSYTHSHTGTTSTGGAHGHSLSPTIQVVGSSGQSQNSYKITSASGQGTTVSAASAGDHSHTFTTSSDTHNHTFTTDSSGGTEARPRNIALLAIIKY